MTDQSLPEHFKGKDAVGHVVEAQAQGIASTAEIHGTEMPGYISAGTDAARETAVFLFVVWASLLSYKVPFNTSLIALSVVCTALLFWKGGRAAWLGWSRLERLHRIVAQEKWEIEHHRKQERDELRALYAAKGFGGKLLEDVLDVLMADGDRLLKVMVEEELGLSLESHEHPLKQGLGAAIGVVVGAFITLIPYFLNPLYGLLMGGFVTIALASAVSAKHEQNRLIPAMIWNMGLGALTFGTAFFLLGYFNH